MWKLVEYMPRPQRKLMFLSKPKAWQYENFKHQEKWKGD